MSKFRPPQTTQLREHEIPAEAQKLIEEGRLPPTLKCYWYGKARVIAMFPYRSAPFSATVSRDDRLATPQEIMLLSSVLIPKGQKVTYVPMNNGQQLEDGRYVVQIFAGGNDVKS